MVYLLSLISPFNKRVKRKQKKANYILKCRNFSSYLFFSVVEYWMCMYVCMCVYIYIYIFIYMCVCVCVCVCVYFYKE